MIVRHSQGIRPPVKPESALAVALREAMERKQARKQEAGG